MGFRTEPKGRRLQEEQIREVIDLASRHDVIFDTVAIDMALQHDTDTSEFKADQAARILKAITPRTPPKVLSITKILQRLATSPTHSSFRLI